MADPDPYSDDPYECLGVSRDASTTEVTVAAAKAKKKFLPDHYPDEEKETAREKLYRVRAAEDAITDGEPYPPEDGLEEDPPGGGGSGGDGTDGGESDGTDGGGGTDDGGPGDTGGGDGTEGPGSETTPSPATLELALPKSDPQVGESVTVSVTADGDSLTEGQLRVDGERTVPIRNGSATVTFEEPGPTELRATADGVDRPTEPTTRRVEVRPRDRSIAVFCTPSEARVGEPVSVEVRDSAGERVTAGRVETDRGHSRSLDRGEATLTFEDPGTVAVEAIAEGGAAGSTTGTAAVTVSQTELELALVPEASTVRAGETVPFTVRDETGSRVDDATVRSDGGETAVTTRGRARLTFDEPGAWTVTAEKDGELTEYVPAETEITVEPKSIRHALELSEPEPAVGESVEVLVRASTGDPGSGITVEATHAESGKTSRTETDATGRGQLTFDERGEYAVETKSPPDGPTAETDETTVEVRPASAALALIPARRAVPPETEVEFTVRDSFGKRVEGATVRANGNTAESDERGVASLRFESPGEYEVAVRKPESAIDYEVDRVDIEVG